MARKPKYSTEFLISILEEYVQVNGMSKIKVSNLVKYCKEKLGYQDITHQIFSRNNQTVKKWIDTFNDRLEQRILNEDNKSILHDFSIDIDFAMKQYRLPEEARELLIRCNNQIATLSTEVQNSVSLYKDTAAERERVQAELSVLKIKLNKATTENEHLKTENQELKQRNKSIQRYLKDYIYDPMVLSHFQEIGLIIDDKEICIPKINPKLVDECDDLVDIVDDFYATDNSLNETEPKDYFDDTANDVTVLSPSSDEWMKRFEDL